MEPNRTPHLVERQMLLRRVRERAGSMAAGEEPGAEVGARFVTISRDVGSGGGELAASLAARLGWQVYDREIVDAIAADTRSRKDLVENLDERSCNLVEDAVERLLSMVEWEPLGMEQYHEALVRTLLVLGSRGQAILIGRGANFALRDQPGLHVRVVASAATRARRLAAGEPGNGRRCARWSGSTGSGGTSSAATTATTWRTRSSTTWWSTPTASRPSREQRPGVGKTGGGTQLDGNTDIQLTCCR